MMRTLLFFIALVTTNLMAMPTVQFLTDAEAISSDAKSATLVAALSSPYDKLVRVPFHVSGSAQFGVDHNLKNGEFIFTPGQKLAFVSFQLLKVSDEEKTLSIELLAPMNAMLGKNSTQIQIISDESFDLPKVSFAKKTMVITEGETFELIAKLDRASSRIVIVPFTATETDIPKSQYNLEDRFFVFLPGEVTSVRSIRVYKRDEYLEEGSLVFNLKGSIQGAQIGDKRSCKVVVRDEKAPPDIELYSIEEKSFNAPVGTIKFKAIGFDPKDFKDISYVLNEKLVDPLLVSINGRVGQVSISPNDGLNTFEIVMRKSQFADAGRVSKTFYVGDKNVRIRLPEAVYPQGTLSYTLHSNNKITGKVQVLNGVAFVDSLPNEKIDFFYVGTQGQLAIASLLPDENDILLEPIQSVPIAPFNPDPVSSLNGWNVDNANSEVVTDTTGERSVRFSTDSSTPLVVSHSFVTENTFFHTNVVFNIADPKDHFKVILVGKRSQNSFVFDKSGEDLLTEIGQGKNVGRYVLPINFSTWKNETIDFIIEVASNNSKTRITRSGSASVELGKIAVGSEVVSSCFIRDNILIEPSPGILVHSKSLKAFSLVNSDDVRSQYVSGENLLIVDAVPTDAKSFLNHKFELSINNTVVLFPVKKVGLNDGHFLISFSLSDSDSRKIFTQLSTKISIFFKIRDGDIERYSENLSGSIPVLVRFYDGRNWHYDNNLILTEELGGDTWMQPQYQSFFKQLVNLTLQQSGEKHIGDISRQNGGLMQGHPNGHTLGQEVDLVLDGSREENDQFKNGASSTRINNFAKLFDDSIIDQTVTKYYIELKDQDALNTLVSICTSQGRYLYAKRGLNYAMNESHNDHFHLSLGSSSKVRELERPYLSFIQDGDQVRAQPKSSPEDSSTYFFLMDKSKHIIDIQPANYLSYNNDKAVYIKTLFIDKDSCSESLDLVRTLGCEKLGKKEVGVALASDGNPRSFISDLATIGEGSTIGPEVTVCGHAEIQGSTILGKATIDGEVLIKGSTLMGNSYVFGTLFAMEEPPTYSSVLDGVIMELFAATFYNVKINGSGGQKILVDHSTITSSKITANDSTHPTSISFEEIKDSEIENSSVQQGKVLEKSKVIRSEVSYGELKNNSKIIDSKVDQFTISNNSHLEWSTGSHVTLDDTFAKNVGLDTVVLTSSYTLRSALDHVTSLRTTFVDMAANYLDSSFAYFREAGIQYASVDYATIYYSGVNHAQVISSEVNASEVSNSDVIGTFLCGQAMWDGVLQDGSQGCSPVPPYPWENNEQ